MSLPPRVLILLCALYIFGYMYEIRDLRRVMSTSKDHSL